MPDELILQSVSSKNRKKQKVWQSMQNGLVAV